MWTEKRQFSEADLNALAEGGVFACFGKGFERTASHTRAVPLSGAALARLTSVASLDPTGGPWGAGAVRARLVSTPEDAPPAGEEGLEIARVFQGAIQTIAFFVMSCGRTIDRDGWRFEPVEGHAAHCQFLGAPAYGEPLDYELVVERFEDGPAAAVTGRVKASASGRLVFQSDDLGLRLVPDIPLTSDLELQAGGEAEARLESPRRRGRGLPHRIQVTARRRPGLAVAGLPRAGRVLRDGRAHDAALYARAHRITSSSARDVPRSASGSR